MIKERMTWDEMVNRYPDQWVVIEDAEMNGSDIISGVIVTAKPDSEITQYRLNNKRRDYEICRTTEGGFDGIIDADISIAVN